MLAWKWGPALACGNTIVMKPAEQTPLTALRIGELAIEAGFPAGVINLINGFGETAGAALVDHPDVDKIAFTGHVDTAKIIQKQAADTLKRTTFELGGKSPNVIFADADLDAAVAGAFHAIYFHGGQCCTAGSRLFVEKKIHKEFVERLAEKAKGRQIGDPLDPAHRAGPAGLAGAARQDPPLRRPRPEARRQARRRRPARRATAASSSSRRSSTTCKDDMAIARDEIFGPVVSVLPFKGVDEVVRAGQQHELRPGRGHLDQGHRQGPPVRQAGQGRHGLGQLLPRRRHHDPVRRLQDVRPGPRERRGGARALHRDQDRHRQARLSGPPPSRPPLIQRRKPVAAASASGYDATRIRVGLPPARPVQWPRIRLG